MSNASDGVSMEELQLATRNHGLPLETLQLPAVTAAITMECAGNGRALLEPRPASQP